LDPLDAWLANPRVVAPLRSGDGQLSASAKTGHPFERTRTYHDGRQRVVGRGQDPFGRQPHSAFQTSHGCPPAIIRHEIADVFGKDQLPTVR